MKKTSYETEVFTMLSKAQTFEVQCAGGKMRLYFKQIGKHLFVQPELKLRWTKVQNRKATLKAIAHGSERFTMKVLPLEENDFFDAISSEVLLVNIDPFAVA